MAPNLVGNSFILAETSLKQNGTNDKLQNGSPATDCPQNTTEKEVTKEPKKQSYKLFGSYFQADIVWRNVYIFVVLHSMALYGVYLVFAESNYLLFLFGYLMALMGGMGITVGAHRLWSHRCYKARLPMRIMLMVFQTLAFQNSLYEWVRDHRVHHKFTDTDADPHNSKRGFFFSHIGWLMLKKHPDVKEKGKTIDMSDLEADPVVVFQRKHYLTLMPILCFAIPALIPYMLWGYSLSSSFFICSVLRYTVSLHFTWLVNSAAHMWGTRPYDKSISSVNNKYVSMLSNGEGWHNYHHVFPWDYKAAELGSYNGNASTGFIDLFSKMGLAYDLKTVSDQMIRQRIARTGDGSHIYSQTDDNNNICDITPTEKEHFLQSLDHDNEENLIWGWDDKDLADDEKKLATILKKHS